MAKHLYRVTFGIKTSSSISETIQTFKRVLVETPAPYVGTDKQVSVFEKQAFKRKFRKDFTALWQSQVIYIASELIPKVLATSTMKADITIPESLWV